MPRSIRSPSWLSASGAMPSQPYRAQRDRIVARFAITLRSNCATPGSCCSHITLHSGHCGNSSAPPACLRPTEQQRGFSELNPLISSRRVKERCRSNEGLASATRHHAPTPRAARAHLRATPTHRTRYLSSSPSSADSSRSILTPILSIRKPSIKFAHSVYFLPSLDNSKVSPSSGILSIRSSIRPLAVS